MNKYQWLWYYYNIIEDKREDIKRQDDLVEYITSFINPELAKTVRDNKNKNNNTNLNTTINDSFEEELKAMLNGEELTELPSSDGYNSNLSEEEFLERAEQFAKLAKTDPNNPLFKMLPRNKKPSLETPDITIHKTKFK